MVAKGKDVLSSRTTSTNAWKPAADGGTANADRAARYMATTTSTPDGKKSAHAGGKNRSGDQATGKRASNAGRSISPLRRGSIPRGPQARGQRASLTSGRPGLNEDDEDSEEDDDPEFKEMWFQGSSGKPPPKGKLQEWSSDPNVRTGMSHPPQSSAVISELTKYLKDYKVPFRLDASPSSRASSRSGSRPSSGSSRSGSPSRARHHSRNSYTSGSNSRRVQGLASAGKSILKSPSQTLQQGGEGAKNDSPTNLESARSSTRSRRELNRSSYTPKASKKEQLIAWLSAMQAELNGDDKKSLKPTSEVALEEHMQRQMGDLFRQSRLHGELLSRWDASDLGDLCLMHNKIRRGTSSKSAPSLLRPPPLQKVKDCSKTLERMTSLSPNYSSGAWAMTSENEGMPGANKAPSTRSLEWRKNALPCSPTRLRHMADTATGDCGPVRLTQLARASGVSLCNGVGMRTR